MPLGIQPNIDRDNVTFPKINYEEFTPYNTRYTQYKFEQGSKETIEY